MSKVQVPTGEVIVRKDKKQRFIMVETKYEFDNDSWGLIKEFMGLGLCDFRKLADSIYEDDYYELIENNLKYFVKQLSFKCIYSTDSVVMKGEDWLLKGFYDIYSMRIIKNSTFTEYDTFREMFYSAFLILKKVIKYIKSKVGKKFQKIKGIDKDADYSQVDLMKYGGLLGRD